MLFVQDFPYSRKKTTTATKNEDYEGYVPDVLKKIGEELNQEYTIHVVGDSKYGAKDPSTNTWTGMIGEIVAQVYYVHCVQRLYVYGFVYLFVDSFCSLFVDLLLSYFTFLHSFICCRRLLDCFENLYSASSRDLIASALILCCSLLVVCCLTACCVLFDCLSS